MKLNIIHLVATEKKAFSSGRTMSQATTEFCEAKHQGVAHSVTDEV